VQSPRLQSLLEAPAWVCNVRVQLLLFDKFNALLRRQLRHEFNFILRQCRFSIQWFLSAQHLSGPFSQHHHFLGLKSCLPGGFWIRLFVRLHLLQPEQLWAHQSSPTRLDPVLVLRTNASYNPRHRRYHAR
jgi:hypothetical protein